jgi:hypothetical protein
MNREHILILYTEMMKFNSQSVSLTGVQLLLVRFATIHHRDMDVTVDAGIADCLSHVGEYHFNLGSRKLRTSQYPL